MHCQLCTREAVGRCYNCGALFCEKHGTVNCVRCEGGIAAGDPRPDRVSAQPLTSTGRPAWWRPQIAEDYEPPACYECKGLARKVCRHCDHFYCPEHAGRGDLCASCYRSSFFGMFVLAGVLLFMGALMLAGWLMN